MKSKSEIRSKVRILEQCVVPSLTYGAQTSATTKTQRDSPRIPHTRMLCSILGVKIRDKIRLENIYGESGAREVRWVIKKTFSKGKRKMEQNCRGKYTEGPEKETRPPPSHPMEGPAGQRLWGPMGKVGEG